MPDTALSAMTAVATVAPATDLIYVVQAGPVDRKATPSQYLGNLIVDSANNLGLRSGVTAQTFRVYGTFTDAGNYERLSLAYDGTNYVIGSENAGTGVARALVWKTGGTEACRILTTGVFVLGAGEAGTPVAQTFRGPDASGTNIADVLTTIRAGLGTGTGNAGTLAFQAAACKQATGTTIHTASTMLAIGHAQGTHPGATGGLVDYPAVTFNDENTAASGTAAQWNAYAFQQPTLSARNTGVVTTDAATVTIANAPAAGTNVTLTRAWALRVVAGRAVFDGGLLIGAEPTGLAGKVAYTNTVDTTANSTGVGSIKFKGATARDSSGFLKIFDGTTARFLPFFDAISG